MTMAMDVHEHFPSHKERIFVDSRVLSLRHIWQVQNPLSQFLVKFYSRFHSGSFLLQYHAGLILYKLS